MGREIDAGCRKDVFLATKVSARKGDEAMRMIQGSLRRLNTDQVDLLHIHSLLDEKDLGAEIQAPGNVLDVVHKMRDQKVARFIGITSHTDPAVLKTALERHDFNCTQMALNAAKAGMAKGVSAYGEHHESSFESLALPVAVRKKMGIIAMKVFAQEQIDEGAGKRPDPLLTVTAGDRRVSWGCRSSSSSRRTLRLAKAFKPMGRQEMPSAFRAELVPHLTRLKLTDSSPYISTPDATGNCYCDMGSNVFMTFAWYGHLKFRSRPLVLAILASSLIALPEYCPAGSCESAEALAS